jgi:DNA-binding protein
MREPGSRFDAAMRISRWSVILKLQGNRAMTRKIKKGQRIGRNPKTGTEVPDSPRRVIVFTPSAILKQRINGHSRGGGVAWVAAMFWIYWDTFWSLFFSAVWFTTIVSHPDAQITDR